MACAVLVRLACLSFAACRTAGMRPARSPCGRRRNYKRHRRADRSPIPRAPGAPRPAPPAPATRPLAAHACADVAIVGAGFTGLSAARHLAEAGVSVTVLEGAEIGHGGSVRNVGLVNAGLWVMPDDLPGVLGPLAGRTNSRRNPD